MDIKVTRHISTNLEEINDKIAKLLKDPLEAFEHASIDVDAMPLLELRAFAENGKISHFLRVNSIIHTTKKVV
jgi:hypothetical protein